MVDRRHPLLSVVGQCRLLDISRSSVYYRSSEATQGDLDHRKLMDRQYLATPFYGSRRFSGWLRTQGYRVNGKWVRRLMRTMGIKAIYRRPRTSNGTPGHRIYPYLLTGMEITRPNQVWAADITYVPMAQGFPYLVVSTDWRSRYVVAWRLSNTPRSWPEAGSGGSTQEGPTGHLQHGPGKPVHQRSHYRDPQATWSPDQHGRKGAV